MLASLQNGKDLAIVLGLAPMVVGRGVGPLRSYAVGTFAIELRVMPGLALVPSIAFVQPTRAGEDLRFFFGLGVAGGALPKLD